MEIRDNCILCMFSEYSESNIFINDLTESDGSTCVHENSPYYKERVTNEHSCRLFIDSNIYFLKKDRRDKLDKLNNIDNFNN